MELMKLKRALSMMLILILTLGTAACSNSNGVGGLTAVPTGGTEKSKNENLIEARGEGYPLTIKDNTNYETVLDKKPEKAAVLSGTPLNIWYDLGGKSICTSEISGNLKVVEAYKEEILKLPSIGPVYAIDLEMVVAQQPDLIIIQQGTQGGYAKKLREMGFKVIITSIKSYEDVLASYETFGKILNSETAAKQRIAELEEKRQELLAKLPDQETSVVILYITSQALAVKLDNSIAGDIANMLSLKNIAAGLPPDTIGSETTPLDIEYIVQQNPDYVLVTSMIADNETARASMQEQFAASPAWKGVKAVAEGRIIYLPQEYFLYNAGPYYGEAIEYAARSIYPEVYGEVGDWYGK
ncbi:Fe(3+)-citrate-binding protein YfmC [bioreactor metagenome]|nr:Periplasmic binding protein [Desulfitobacterium hafniense]